MLGRFEVTNIAARRKQSHYRVRRIIAIPCQPVSVCTTLRTEWLT
jgi:hypothetical protein